MNRNRECYGIVERSIMVWHSFFLSDDEAQLDGHVPFLGHGFVV